MQDNGNEMLSIKEAGEYLGVCAATVRRRIKAGKLKAKKVNGPYGLQYMIPKDEITKPHVITDVVAVSRPVPMARLTDSIKEAIEARDAAVFEGIQKEMKALREEVIRLRVALDDNAPTTGHRVKNWARRNFSMR